MAPKPKLSPEEITTIRARLAADPTLTVAGEARAAGIDPANLSRALARLAASEAAAKPVAAAPRAEPENDVGLAMLDYLSIERSALNPRKTFDPGELAELAESIAENGLLQNLVVRASPEGHFILVAGERRLRAIGLLVDAGRWHDPIPCLVIEADDASHLALALLENLHRQDVAPLEEADAFAQLQAIDPEVWTAQAIATRIGRTPRYVYQRLAMAHNLIADAKKLLAAGMINVEGARLLGAETPEVQQAIINSQWENWRDSETDPDSTEIDIEDNDLPIAVSQIKGELKWLARQAASEKIRAEREAARLNGTPMPETADESDDGTGYDPSEETEEEKAERLRLQAERQAEWQKRSDENAARHAEVMAHYQAVAHKLPTDWPAEHSEHEGNVCRDGCKFRTMLQYTAPHQYHVCMNPASARAGLLTHEEQGGRDCFVVA